MLNSKLWSLTASVVIIATFRWRFDNRTTRAHDDVIFLLRNKKWHHHALLRTTSVGLTHTCHNCVCTCKNYQINFFLQEFWEPSWQLHQQQRLFEVHTATTKGQRSTVVFCVYLYKKLAVWQVWSSRMQSFHLRFIRQYLWWKSLGSRLYEGLSTVVG